MCCVEQSLLDAIAGRVGVIECRCVHVCHRRLTVDSLGEVTECVFSVRIHLFEGNAHLIFASYRHSSSPFAIWEIKKFVMLFSCLSLTCVVISVPE